MTINGQKTVTAMAWVWVGLGGMIFAGSAGAFVITSLQPHLKPGAFERHATAINWVFKHYSLISGLEAVFAVGVILTALGLLKRKAWARIVLRTEILIMIALLIAFAVVWAQACTEVIRHNKAPAFVLGFAIGFAIVVSAVNSIPLLICLWLLGRREVKNEFRRKPPPMPVSGCGAL